MAGCSYPFGIFIILWKFSIDAFKTLWHGCKTFHNQLWLGSSRYEESLKRCAKISIPARQFVCCRVNFVVNIISLSLSQSHGHWHHQEVFGVNQIQQVVMNIKYRALFFRVKIVVSQGNTGFGYSNVEMASKFYILNQSSWRSNLFIQFTVVSSLTFEVLLTKALE